MTARSARQAKPASVKPERLLLPGLTMLSTNDRPPVRYDQPGPHGPEIGRCREARLIAGTYHDKVPVDLPADKVDGHPTKDDLRP